MAAIAGVLFDLGGVVMASPLHAIARYERDHGLPEGAVNRAIRASGDGGAWSRLELGELTLEAFLEPFEADCRTCGVAVDCAILMRYIADASAPRPAMVEAVRRIRARGLRAGALTNNWVTKAPRAPHPVRDHFDVFIESSAVGLRKPDPRIYELACRALGVTPERTAFLDDIGANLKSARALGITTIKVTDPVIALRELSDVLGFDLGQEGS
ncbi:MAG TPA: HAD family phosphatase [Methylomirabilota bacterium]|jgi:epoxide hydrolase-like predicted phosphatase|nr:HAD family phosphatase [Methylomirabilota bacterium]